MVLFLCFERDILADGAQVIGRDAEKQGEVLQVQNRHKRKNPANPTVLTGKFRRFLRFLRLPLIIKGLEKRIRRNSDVNPA